MFIAILMVLSQVVYVVVTFYHGVHKDVRIITFESFVWPSTNKIYSEEIAHGYQKL